MTRSGCSALHEVNPNLKKKKKKKKKNGNCEKLLGVLLDSKLTFKPHIAFVEKQV